MPWYSMLQVPENIKKRACIYLLQRYLGQFFEEKLSLDQLSLDLYNGTGTVRNISLDVQALNELGEKQNWPMEFVDGFVQELFVSVPWASLLKDSSFIEVRGLKLTVQPKQRSECATSMFESMWSSMSSSMQLAEECIKQDPSSTVDAAQPLEVIERFAQTIDSVLSRVKVKFVDTIIQIEHVPKDSSTGVGVVINIPHMEYMDAAGDDPAPSDITNNHNSEQNKAFIVSSFTIKNFYFEGVTFSTVEFPSRARTFSRSVISQSDTQDSDKEEIYVTMVDKDTLSTNKTEDSSEFKLRRDENERHVVQFGRLAGKQLVSVRLKQSEEVQGPKVSISFEMGSFIAFLSPRQFHVLIELANGLSSPDTEDTSNVIPRHKCAEKPMSGIDYLRIEQELQTQLHPLSTFQKPGLQGIRGWSTSALDESDSDDNFLPLKNKNSEDTMMYDSALSGVSGSMESSITSSTSTFSENPTRSRRKVSNLESDPTAEISHFKITVASLAVILLHEDIITISADYEATLISSSVKQMQNTAEAFFSNLGLFGTKDFDSAKGQFEKACSLNHLRLLAAPFHIEGNETTTATGFSVSGKVTVAKLELLECLSNGKGKPFEHIKLLHFNADDKNSPLLSRPNFRLSFKHIEKSSKTALNRTSSIPRTELTICLESCVIEVDITIVDRLSALLNPQQICVINRPVNVWSIPNNPLSKSFESRLDLKVNSPSVNLTLRFPIPDFRPPHDLQRNPWWKRNVRSDYAVIKLMEFAGITSWCTNQSCQKYAVQCCNAELFYVEADSTVLLPIGKVGSDDKCGTSLEGRYHYPRLELQIYPTIKPELQFDHSYEAQSDPMTQSTSGVLSGSIPKDNGPFTSKRVVHESDTPHNKPQHEEIEELVMPGDKQEINDFIESTMQSSKIQLDVTLPTVSMQLVSKYIYEVLYNRINNDLLLWSPSAPSSKPNECRIFSTRTDSQELFSMCRSGMKYDSDSDSTDEDDTLQSGIYYSSYDRIKHSHKTPVKPKSYGQSFFSLNLHIDSGLLCMHVPVRDMSLNVIPGQHGEFLFNMADINVFSVSGYCGDENLGYVCVQSTNAQLYHCDMMSTSSQTPMLKDIGSAISRHLHPTIYKSDPGVVFSTTDRTGGREMLSLAVRIQASHETHHVKTVRVALGLSKATLRHRMCQEPNSWISQLIDFFNVLDYPIPGYRSKDVLTELHLHVWNCAIDYRPLHLPLRSLVTVGNFTMSSHLSAQSNTSTLRFIAEDGAIFLSDKAPPRSGVPSTVPVDIKRDYICVIDVGLFELSLKTTDKNSGINPHIDLRVSNNIVHVRTCADSGRALMQLITYYASDGDLTNMDSSVVINNSPQHQMEQELVNVEPQSISNLSQSQHQHVNTLIGEAMTESCLSVDEVLQTSSSGAKMFFFPDEATKELGKPLPQVIHDLGDITRHSNKSSDTDDDFCFIGNEVGVGLMPKNGVPEIRWLTNDALRVIDNHFSIPVGKTDLLKPPSDFPPPVTRCTLCEMSIVWHMYGGNDFNSDGKQKKTVNFYDGVGYSNTHTGEVLFTSSEEKKNANLNWQIQGGVSRDHKVLMEFQLNKVRFQHEVYAENLFHASRQVLIISELEIRDRLASSQINKFLYQYTSQARPKQSHANMVVVKAVHIRTDPKLKPQECALTVSLLPLRLNIDQDALLFLIGFFNELVGGPKSDEFALGSTSKNNTPTHQRPIMTVNIENQEEIAEHAQKMVDENLLILLEENRNLDDLNEVPPTVLNSAEESPPIYFRSIVFSPEVPIRLDYHGKRVDMTHGPLPGLLMGLGQLNCSELRLKRLAHRHGLLGFEKLLNYCLHEWLQDIKRNQLPSLLGGVGPMHSLVQLFQGIKDLFWLPIEQYQKDGRIVRGLQRGANSFTTSTAMAALELTSRIIHLIQITAETAYDMVSPGPSVRRAKTKGRKKRYTQPQDIREGVANAYMLVKEGIGETADNLVRAASHEHEQKGYSGAVGGVLRQIPSTVVKPIIIATEATSNLLGGMQNQLVPDARTEAKQKWRTIDDN